MIRPSDARAGPPPAGSAISIRGVSKSFGSTRAVRDLDLEVPRGSLTGFLGPNGAGKSTTIRMILSILRPDSGAIDVLGGDALAEKDRIGYLPEERGLYRKMRVADYLAYIARLKGARRQGLDARVQAWLERLELGEARRRRCQELSKGMQQKVQFLAAVVHEPELVILDEPFSGLDPVNAVLLNEVIRELHGAGRTIVFSTHVLFQAEQICERILLIHKGEKRLDATLEEIRARFDPRTLRVELHEGGAGAPADLEALAGVARARRREGGAFELELSEGADPQPVMRAVLERHRVRALEVRRATLEEVFVRVVREVEGVRAAEEAEEELSRVAGP